MTTASTARQTMGIPRLQELQYLTTTAQAVAAGLPFDHVRRALIQHMEQRSDVPGGNNAAYRLAADDPGRYVTNASTALKELMWLGLLDRAPVPSRASAAPAYAAKRYSLTDAGQEWISTLERDRPVAFDELLRRLWVVHPQFAGMFRILAEGEFVVPTQSWSALHPERVGKEGRAVYVRALAAKCARAIATGRTGWRAGEAEIVGAIEAYTTRLQESAARRGRQAFPNHRAFVQACEEALVSFAFGRAGAPIDYISVEILRRWTQELLIANFSYHVPAGGATALRFWSTADLVEEHGHLTAVRRRPPAEWVRRVQDVLPEAFDRARVLESDRSYVSIFRVRAAVCHELRINDVVFDVAMRKLAEASAAASGPFRLSFELFHGALPPTARPLRLPGRTGAHEFHLMSLVPNRTRS